MQLRQFAEAISQFIVYIFIAPIAADAPNPDGLVECARNDAEYEGRRSVDPVALLPWAVMFR